MSQKRNTIQKTLVLEVAKNLGNHPRADDVYEKVILVCPTISKATVYRNLNSLVDEGELRRIMLPNEADRFDQETKPHYHIKCNICSKFSDLSMEYMTDMDATVEKISGYSLESHSIIFNGLCPCCKN